MKYAPLQEYLETIASNKEHVTLAFDEIEKIIGATLPRSAFTYREWWANQQGGSRAPYWRAAGFLLDAVDLDRKLAYFRRSTSEKIGKPHKKSDAGGRRTQPIPVDTLLKADFNPVGHWELRNDAIVLIGDIPTNPGVYAHVVNGEVYYIGLATMGLKKRLYFYGKPGKSQRTSIRINGLIKEVLGLNNRVDVIAAFPDPSTWNGLPVDQVSGLEAGLIRKFSPPWNMRGT